MLAKVVKNLRIATSIYKKSAKYFVILAEMCSERNESVNFSFLFITFASNNCKQQYYGNETEYSD